MSNQATFEKLFGLVALFALLAALLTALDSTSSSNEQRASCEPGSLIQKAGCFDVPREPDWYPYGGGSAGRPMIPYGIQL